MQLDSPLGVELCIGTVPVDLQLQRQLRAGLGAARHERIGTRRAPEERADRALVENSDPIERLAVKGLAAFHVLLGSRVAVDLVESRCT
jgi:hypothetical protein